MQERTIEQRTADAVLQASGSVRIGGKTYEIAPPTLATLIMVSALTSKLPQQKPDQEKAVQYALAVAKDCAVIGDIAAALILGAKRIKKRRLWGLLPNPDLRRLSRRILEDAGIQETAAAIFEMLAQMQIGDFFALTASLIEVNLLRQTREAVETTTASGA